MPFINRTRLRFPWIMGAFCSCLQLDYSDHHGNQASSVFRNCMCLRCFTQQLINAYTVLFRAGAVHSVTPAIEATPVDSTESSFNTYRSPPRPLPYDDPQFSPPAHDWLRRESPSHSPDESEPLRANDDDEEMETPSRIDKASKTNYNTKMKISSSAYGDKVPPRGHGNYFSYFSPSAEDEDVCPTCLEDYDSENPRIVMQCSHHFHLGCIYEWMERSEACPVCGKALVLARSQTRQSELFASQAETERQDKDRRLKELEKENAALKKAAEDERTARRQAQREAKKLKGELTTLRSSFDEDRAGISALADGLVSKYVQCLKSTGVLSDGPGESDLRGCLAWLRRELDALEGHMSLSCDYASAAGIKAIGVSLLNVGCSHTADLAVADVDACWRTPPEVKILGKKFFEEFWLGGGNDMALIQSAVGRAKTSEERAQIR